MTRLILSVVGLVALLSSGATSARDHEKWIGTYAKSPTGLPTVTKLGPVTIPAPVQVKGTCRYRIRVSRGGQQIRLRLSNEYGHTPLQIGAVSVGMAADDLDALPGTLRKATFAGRETISIPARAPVLTDPIDLAVESLGDLIVSVYVLQGVSLLIWPDEDKARQPGLAIDQDVSMAEHFSSSRRLTMRPLVSAVDVLASARSVVATLGDSITDGSVDPATGERGWPDVLSRRLKGHGVSVVNAGIGGNQLLQSLDFMGSSALARLEQDVFSVPGLTHILVLEGINDIGMNGPHGFFEDTSPVTAEALIVAYQQIVARARERGIKVVGATILPFEGAHYYTAEKEQVRQAVNAWIRNSKTFDGVVDFDTAMREPVHPGKLKAEYDGGDHLHPNFAGLRKMGEVVDLDLFR